MTVACFSYSARLVYGMPVHWIASRPPYTSTHHFFLFFSFFSPFFFLLFLLHFFFSHTPPSLCFCCGADIYTVCLQLCDTRHLCVQHILLDALHASVPPCRSPRARTYETFHGEPAKLAVNILQDKGHKEREKNTAAAVLRAIDLWRWGCGP